MEIQEKKARPYLSRMLQTSGIDRKIFARRPKINKSGHILNTSASNFWKNHKLFIFQIIRRGSEEWGNDIKLTDIASGNSIWFLLVNSAIGGGELTIKHYKLMVKSYPVNLIN